MEIYPAIKNDDAVQLGKILNIDHLQPEITRCELVRDIIKCHCGPATTDTWIQVYQFLESNGYQLPI